jgi:hypothetical protein
MVGHVAPPLVEDPRVTDTSPALVPARPGPGSEDRSGPSTGACVMLDVGEGAGALVVYTSERATDREIEIRSHEGEWAGVHTAVRPRHVGDIVLHAGVFGSLPAGLYDVRIRHGESATTATVRVVPEAVTETTLAENDEGP